MSSTFETSTQSPAGIPGLLLELVRGIVHHPEQVRVESTTSDECTELRVHVADDDVFRVMGQHGRTAQSLRIILNAAGMKLRHRFSLLIVESSHV